MSKPLPSSVPVVIIGAGFAGAATAWALGQRRIGHGVILEQEETYAFHASGRNAAILRLVESDPVIRALAVRSARRVRALEEGGAPLLKPTGGLTLGGTEIADALVEEYEATRSHPELRTELLSAADARSRFPLLEAVDFDRAVWCPAEAIVDIHALVTLYLKLAHQAKYSLRTRCQVLALSLQRGRVAGVETSEGTIRADMVIDASGAWAGRLGRKVPLPLQPMRRHLFVSGPPPGGHRDSPFAWVEDAGFYFRPEGDGLLLSPCDETPMAPGDPPTDPAAAELLAVKLSLHARPFLDLPIRRSWACLRTFAPDRRPFIGPDPDMPGLFHVSGLGGFGMGSSAAVGELAASVIANEKPDWIDPALVAVGRRIEN